MLLSGLKSWRKAVERRLNCAAMRPSRRRRRAARDLPVAPACERLEERVMLSAEGWAHIAGGAQRDFGFDVAYDDNGAAYISGAFEGEMDFDGDGTVDATATGEWDLFAAKYSAQGELEWSHTGGGSQWDAAFGIEVDSDRGAVYLAGYQNMDDVVPLNESNLYVTRLETATGDIGWEMQLEDGFARGLDLDDNGNLYVAGGFFEQTLNFGDGVSVTNSGGGGTDIFVAALDPNGTPLWAEGAGGESDSNDEYARSVAASDVGVYLGAAFYGEATFGDDTLVACGDPVLPGNPNQCEPHVHPSTSRLTTDGTFEWTRQIEDRNADIHEVAIDANGNGYITGDFMVDELSFDGHTVQSAGDWADGFLAKVDAAGNYQWANEFVGENYGNAGWGLAMRPNGDIAVTGKFDKEVHFEDNLSITSPSGQSAFHATAASSDGTFLEAEQIVRGLGDGIAVDDVGNLYVAGDGDAQPDDPFPTGETFDTEQGDRDAFVMVLQSASPPAVTITNPSDGTAVSGTTTVTADASDSDGSVTQVEFFVDGGAIGTDTDGSDGWSASWDTTQYAEGGHTVTAEATDDGGATGSDSVSVTVDNNAAPTVSITNPADGATVSDTVTVTADASDSDGSVTQVEFFVDGGPIGIDTDGSDGWSASWDTTQYAEGGHTVTAEATDDYPETAVDTISVTVDNVAEPKFYVPDDDADGTFQYDADGGFVTSTGLDRTAPRGATANLDGSRVWVVDGGKTVSVYDGGGSLLGTWNVKGGINDPQGIATDPAGEHIWIVDAKKDEVAYFDGGGSFTSGNHGPSAKFGLDNANGNPTGLTTDGTSLWVSDDGSTDRVFKYDAAGSLQGSWAIDGTNADPTGITLDPSGSSSSLWIADSGADAVFEYADARKDSGGSLADSFALTTGNTNPQGIADPPAGEGSSADADSASVDDSAEAALPQSVPSSVLNEPADAPAAADAAGPDVGLVSVETSNDLRPLGPPVDTGSDSEPSGFETSPVFETDSEPDSADPATLDDVFTDLGNSALSNPLLEPVA